MSKFLMALLLATFGFTALVQADIPPIKFVRPERPDDKDKKEEEEDAHTEYKEVIKKAGDWTKSVLKESFYKDLVLKNKKTGEEKKITELPRFDQEMFFLLQVERLNDQLEEVHKNWTSRLNDYDKLREAPPKADLEKYIAQIHEWHKKASAKHKQQAEHLFKVYKDQFSKEETEQYLKKLAEYQKKHKLEVDKSE